MLRFMLILEVSAEECHAKDRVEPAGISMIKYRDITSHSFLFDAFAYAAYIVCLRLLNTGVSLMKQFRFAVMEIYFGLYPVSPF